MTQISNFEHLLRKPVGLVIWILAQFNFGIAKQDMSSTYLQEKATSTCETWVDITCSKTNQVRFIPMEVLMQTMHGRDVLTN